MTGVQTCALPICSRMPLSEPVSAYSLNPIVKHSFKIWSQFRRAFSLNEFSIYSPITKNNMFVPSVADSAFKCWVEKGIRIVKDLFVEDTFISFEQLRTHFNITQSHFFRYLQLRSFISSSYSQFPLLPPHSFLDTILKISPQSKKCIGVVYSLLNSYNLKPLTLLKQQWEEELDMQISTEMWQDILDGIHFLQFV